MSESDPNRRQVLYGIAAGGAAVTVLAGCGSEDGPSASGSPSVDPFTVDAAEIPVGSGKIFAVDKVVVTQPSAGEFKAFSAVCTHQGCVVSKMEDDVIACGCHFSRYAIADGHVLGGPAPRPLPELPISVDGSTLTVG